MAEIPVIVVCKCNGCGLCVAVCSGGALSLVEDVVVFEQGVQCEWCTQCEAVCPTGAIGCPFEIVIEEG